MKSSKVILLLLCLFVSAQNITAQTKPVDNIGSNPVKVFALTNAKIVVSPTKTIEKGTIVIRDHSIESVGADVSVPKDAVTYDLSGKTVYAGFIDFYSTYGLRDELKPAQGTSPAGAAAWNPKVTPQNRAVNLFTPDEKAAEKLRSQGLTTVHIVPKSGIIRGFGALVNLGNGSTESQILSNKTLLNTSIRSSADFWTDPYPNSQMGVIALTRQMFYDAQWYANKMAAYRQNPTANKAPDYDPSLEELATVLASGQPIVMESSNELETIRNSKIASEFNLKSIFLSSGTEYKNVSDIKALKSTIVIPVNFTEAPDLTSPEKIMAASVDELLAWDYAPENPMILEKNQIPFALTSKELKDPAKFLSQIRISVKRGLSESGALAALTTVPASLLGADRVLGTVEAGKTANLTITTGNIFSDESAVNQVWIDGTRYDVKAEPVIDFRGVWSSSSNKISEIEIKGKPESLTITAKSGSKTIKFKTAKTEFELLTGSFDADSIGVPGAALVSFSKLAQNLTAQIVWPDLQNESITFTFKEAAKDDAKKDEKKPGVQNSSFPLTYPFGAFGHESKQPEQPAYIIVKNTTVWTSSDKGILTDTDVLIEKGKIKSIGKNLTTPKDALTIDGKGKHLSAGLIDAHSHNAIDGGVNEGGQAMTSEVRVQDVLDPYDINIYYQLAGGVTSANLMHGSANAIGGQTQTVKYRWGGNAQDIMFENALPGIKFALGENPKRSSSPNSNRYPQTRLGVNDIIRDYFKHAIDYKKEWDQYNKNKKGVAPRRDIELDALVDILEGKRTIQCHSYVQSEILGLIRIADELGFKVGTFQHVLEGYKVADEIKKHGAMASTFSDWWGYKYEVIDAIPYNGPIMDKVGVVVSYNSDSNELARRLNMEAAKAVKYGGLSQNDALKFVTLNPAKQLGIDKRVGSIEEGKDADFVIWSGSPLSSFSKPEQTWIDGRLYFDLAKDTEMRKSIRQMKSTLAQKVLASGQSAPKENVNKLKPKIHECFDYFEGLDMAGGAQ